MGGDFCTHWLLFQTSGDTISVLTGCCFRHHERRFLYSLAVVSDITRGDFCTHWLLFQTSGEAISVLTGCCFRHQERRFLYSLAVVSDIRRGDFCTHCSQPVGHHSNDIFTLAVVSDIMRGDFCTHYSLPVGHHSNDFFIHWLLFQTLWFLYSLLTACRSPQQRFLY